MFFDVEIQYRAQSSDIIGCSRTFSIDVHKPLQRVWRKWRNWTRISLNLTGALNESVDFEIGWVFLSTPATLCFNDLHQVHMVKSYDSRIKCLLFFWQELSGELSGHCVCTAVISRVLSCQPASKLGRWIPARAWGTSVDAVADVEGELWRKGRRKKPWKHYENHWKLPWNSLPWTALSSCAVIDFLGFFC